MKQVENGLNISSVKKLYQQNQCSALYKTHKPNNPVCLSTTGCNTVTENLSRFIEVVCVPLTNNIETRIRDTSHLLDIIDEFNLEIFLDNFSFF